jgi:hypothetical protein
LVIRHAEGRVVVAFCQDANTMAELDTVIDLVARAGGKLFH